MYLEWRIPSGAGGAGAAHFCNMLINNIDAWSKQWGIPYRTKIHKYTLRLTLGLDKDYDWFMLTWDADKAAGNTNSNWFRFKVVEPMKIDKTQ
jgi:hypothetical protein